PVLGGFMRKNNVIRFLGSAVLMAPLLVACGQDNVGGGGDSTTPICPAGQALSTNSGGKIICKALPTDVVILPVCKKDTDALTANGQGASCTPRSTGNNNDAAIIDRLNKIDATVIDYGTKINGLA